MDMILSFENRAFQQKFKLLKFKSIVNKKKKTFQMFDHPYFFSASEGVLFIYFFDSIVYRCVEFFCLKVKLFYCLAEYGKISFLVQAIIIR